MKNTMYRRLAVILGLVMPSLPMGNAFAVESAPAVLIVADEIPAMEALANELKIRVQAKSTIVAPDRLPETTAAFAAIVVYIHQDLTEQAETALINYANGGGKLILLHHSISSAKRKNKRWFAFVGITLPLGDLDAGGYKYYEPVAFDLVNVAPKNFVTTHKVTYPKKIAYGKGAAKPAFTFEGTEVYVNHVLAGERTVLLALHYLDTKTGKVFDQDIAGWQKKAGKGQVYYFMPGHRAADFQNPVYAQILANAVVAKFPRR